MSLKLTYEYYCENCHNRWQIKQKISEDPVTTCPRCLEDEKGKVYRVIPQNESGFILKGQGWAKDGYTKKKTDGETNGNDRGARQPDGKPVHKQSGEDADS